MERGRQRPGVVRVIGWLSILFAVWSILTTGWLWFANRMLVPRVEKLMASMPDDFLRLWNPMFEVHTRLQHHYSLLMSLQTALALVVLVAGVEFLRARSWARTALEASYWLTLAYWVAFDVFLVAYALRMPAEGGGAALTSGRVYLLGAATMATLTWGVPIGIIIHFLRGKTVREAVS